MGQYRKYGYRLTPKQVEALSQPQRELAPRWEDVVVWSLVQTTKLEERSVIVGKVMGVQASLGYGQPMTLSVDRQCTLAAYFVVK